MVRLFAVIWFFSATCVLHASELENAVYDDGSPEAIAVNDRALARAIEVLPAEGGSIELDYGHLHVSQPIVSPNRWFVSGNSDYRPINFRLAGKINTRLVLHSPTPADTSDDWLVVLAPNYPANYPDRNVRVELESVTLDKGGLKIQGGSKFTTVNNVRITGAPLGLDCRGFDGGSLENLYIHGCQDGAFFSDCAMIQLNRFTVRLCSDTGMRGVRLQNVSGQVYLEANAGLQGDFTECRRWNAMVWYEDHTGAGNRILVKRRNCWGLLSGMTQDDNCFDDDPYSRAMCKTVTEPQYFPPLGTPTDTQPTRLSVYGGASLIKAEALTLICRPGALAQSGDRYAEFRDVDTGWDFEFKTGDWVQVDYDLSTDQATRDWAGSKWILATSFQGGNPHCIQNVRLREAVQHVTIQGKATRDGRGLRMFCFMLPREDHAAELRFTFSNVQVRHLKNP